MSYFILIYIKTKSNHNTLTLPFRKSKTVSFASSIIKNIVALFSRFPVKLICCIAFRSASNFCCLLKSIELAYNVLWNKDYNTSNNFSNVIICYLIIFYWLIKGISSVNHSIVIFYFFFWKIITCVLLYQLYFHVIKQLL